MTPWELPTSLCIGGTEYEIRTDYRAILDILKWFSDPEYDTDEQWEICLTILYSDYENMPEECKEEAARKAQEFIDMGMSDDGRKPLRLMDWEQDAPIILPAINRVLQKEIRSEKYLHWWTFLGAYMEIGESLFTNVLNIRQKKAKNKKLEKWENEFLQSNRSLVEIRSKYTVEELKQRERLNQILNGG